MAGGLEASIIRAFKFAWWQIDLSPTAKGWGESSLASASVSKGAAKIAGRADFRECLKANESTIIQASPASRRAHMSLSS